LIRLEQAALSPGMGPGDVIALRLEWVALEPLSESYLVSVQLVGPGGTSVAMRVGPVQNGVPPVSTWQPGQPKTEIYAFGLGANAPEGDYEFLVTMRSVMDSVRLQTADGQDEVVIGPVSVVS
jgi:hypothetical protein